MTTYVGGTGTTPVGMTPGEQRGRGAGFWIRTVLATAAGVVAAGLLSLAGILTVSALVVVSPEHPGRAFAALLLASLVPPALWWAARSVRRTD